MNHSLTCPRRATLFRHDHVVCATSHKTRKNRIRFKRPGVKGRGYGMPQKILDSFFEKTASLPIKSVRDEDVSRLIALVCIPHFRSADQESEAYLISCCFFR